MILLSLLPTASSRAQLWKNFDKPVGFADHGVLLTRRTEDAQTFDLEKEYSLMRSAKLQMHIARLHPTYQTMFADRSSAVPSDPLEFHVYHLSLYWSRLVGFCMNVPGAPDSLIDGDLGASVAVGTDFVSQTLDSSSAGYEPWLMYRVRVDAILEGDSVGLSEVLAASDAFDAFVLAIHFQPFPKWMPHAWKRHATAQISD